MEWQPIETAPKGTPVAGGYARGPQVLGLYQNENGDWRVYNIVSFHWHKDGKRGSWKSNDRTWEPSHWMPLPPAPEAGK